MSQLNTKKVKFGDNVDLSKNFVWSVPAVADGTFTLAREDGTIVWHTDGNSIFKGNLFTGAAIEVGSGVEGTGDRVAFIDLHSQDGVDYDARFERGGGANGFTSIHHRGTGELWLNCENAAPIIFKTASAERMRISSDGHLFFNDPTYTQPGAGNTNSGFKMESTADGPTIFISRTNFEPLSVNKNADGYLMAIRRSGTLVGGILVTTTNTTFATSSDHRLKKNVRAMVAPLTRLLRLKPVAFNWRLDDSEGEGFLAHELQAEVPMAVTGEKDAVRPEDDDFGKAGDIIPQGVDLSKLVPLLVAAVQELAQEVAALKAQLGNTTS